MYAAASTVIRQFLKSHSTPFHLHETASIYRIECRLLRVYIRNT